MQVHNAALKNTELVQEDFQLNGDGSAFVTREDEMVVLSVTGDGLDLLPEKVRQLVDRGFHAIVVDLDDVEALEKDNLKLFLKSKQILENWDGWLGLINVNEQIKTFFNDLEVSSDFKSFDSIDDAVTEQVRVQDEKLEAEKNSNDADASDSDSSFDSADLLASDDLTSSDSALFDSAEDSAAVVSPTESSSQSSNGTSPHSKIKEIVVQAEELPRLGWQIDRAIESGVLHVTLRLVFNRRMTGDDVDQLKKARDRLDEVGGQLILAALQREVSLWLKLRDLEKEFLICEDVESAEQAHQQEAAQSITGSSETESSVTLSVHEFDSESAIIRAPGSLSGSREQELLTIMEVGDWKLSGLIDEIRRLGGDEVHDLVLEGHTTHKITSSVKDSLQKAIDMASGVGVHLTFCLFSADNINQLNEYKSQSNVTIAETLKEACLDCAERSYGRSAFSEIEYAFNRIGLEPSSLLDFARAQTEEMDATSEDRSGLQNALSEKDAEIARLRSELTTAQNSAPSKFEAGALDAVKKQLEQAIRDKNSAKSESSRLEGELSEVKRRLSEESEKVAKAESNQSKKNQDLQGELDQVKKDKEESDKKLKTLQTELESERSKASRLEGRFNVVNEELEKERENANQVKLQLQAAQEQSSDKSGGPIDLEALPEDPGELKTLLQQSEEDKLRILADAQVEIERLTREQDALREELESAGEMIERLGKELELS
ncbi:MAG: hypothetical protein P1V97_12500 [Planctomycetota bacterium]|nr:hypothetical protein [Planctomycetota bacterium]